MAGVRRSSMPSGATSTRASCAGISRKTRFRASPWMPWRNICTRTIAPIPISSFERAVRSACRASCCGRALTASITSATPTGRRSASSISFERSEATSSGSGGSGSDRRLRSRDARLAISRPMVKPFRFGVSVRSAGSPAEFADKARKLEDLGYSVLAVPDHLTDLLAPMPALVGAAAATKRLRVATMVLNNDFRHPIFVAREAATVDLLSDGRLELGLGAGHMKFEYDQAGLTFDPGAIRVERLGEAVVIVKRLLEGGPVTFSGCHYRVTDHTIHPRPAQRPRPPIFIGGSAPRLLTLAAREADIVGLTGITFRRGGAVRDVSAFKAGVVDDRLGLVRETAGDRYERIELNALVQRVVVTDD